VSFEPRRDNDSFWWQEEEQGESERSRGEAQTTTNEANEAARMRRRCNQQGAFAAAIEFPYPKKRAPFLRRFRVLFWLMFYDSR